MSFRLLAFTAVLLLALAGAAIVLAGLACLALGGWFFIDPTALTKYEHETSPASVGQITFLLGTGTLAAGLGGLAMWPFVRWFRASDPSP